MKHSVRHAVVQPPDTTIRLIPLTQGQNATVDTADFERISKYAWVADWNARTQGFYATTLINKKKVYMHRLVLGVTDTKIYVDHIAPDSTLDNRQSNLRIADRRTNAQNRRINRKHSTGYKGVSKQKAYSGWFAAIEVKGKRVYLGTYRTPEAAAMAYDMAAIGYFGEFARTNFPKHIYILC